jgi:hypothetical protein
MYIVFNIVVIGCIALIAYWWANQGLFSALLHLLAVIVAGAIALAIWEPIVVNYLLTSAAGFSNYAWGVTLIGCFTILLLIIRVALDKLIPNNVNMPRAVDLGFGLPVGACAGVITAGIFLIGAGFLQGSNEVVGFRGWGRNSNGQIKMINRLWVPAHTITSEFYSMLSVGSLGAYGGTSTPLKQYNPQLDRQMTLVRDGFASGKAALAMPPDGVNVNRLIHLPNGVGDMFRGSHYAVELEFNNKAQDHARQLTLSRAQVRLIGYATGMSDPEVTFPRAWLQEVSVNNYHLYDYENDPTAYIISLGGQESLKTMIIFPAPQGQQPRFIQIRNTRFALPGAETNDLQSDALARLIESNIRAEDIFADADTGGDITSAISIDSRVRGLLASTNKIPSGIRLTSDNYIESGTGEFPKGTGGIISKGLRLKGLAEPPGTRVIQMDVGLGSPASMYGSILERVDERAEFYLIDADGRTYTPIGFLHFKPNGSIVVNLDPVNRLRNYQQLPGIPRAGGHQIKLVFRVTAGITITGFRWGGYSVGECNLIVPEND